ncbi:MAG: CehA/McbA family metallohydrolase [Myxococcota bacterium]
MGVRRPGPGLGRWLAGGLLALVCSGCPAPESEAPPEVPDAAPAASEGLSPNARPDIHDMLALDRAREPDPSDGAGRAWLVRTLNLSADDPDAALEAGGRARFELAFEAGPDGIAVGGAVFLQTSPFWGWDTPQVEDRNAPGYTEVTTSAAGVSLSAATVDRNLLAVEIGGRALAPGERIDLVLGAGPAGARVDRFAERDERLFFAVDGDGDGTRSLLGDSPTVDVGPGPPARLRLVLPSTIGPGETATLRVVWLDAQGSAGVGFRGTVELEVSPPDVAVERSVRFEPEHGGVRALPLVAPREGPVRVAATARTGPGDDDRVRAESNPLMVSASAPRILWADLHGHSQLSDGTGRPDDFFRYARDVAGLDVAALTDHDHWGLRALDDRPALWSAITRSVRAHHEPGRFVALLGYEWTSWLHGHRHVLHFSDEGPVWSSLDPDTTDPAGLWRAIGERPALTFAHHSAGGPVATNWRFVPPPEIEPVTEVVSVHGSSEALDAPGRIYDPQPGNFVRDILDRGVRFGFIGSGDSHDGHPGLTHLASLQGGLAAIFAEERTRDAVRQALLARRCYATNGPRIWLRTALDGRPMGSAVAARPADRVHRLDVVVLAPGEIERIEVVRSGEVAARIDGEGQRSFAGELELPGLAAGEYLYLRVVQRDGGAAWSSPFYADPP